MTKEEWMKLNLNDYIYRDVDGWGGALSSAPGKKDIKDWSDNQTLSFKGIIPYPKNYKTHANEAKSSDHNQWQMMNVETCTNPLALARFNLYLHFALIDSLRNTSIL